MKLSQQHLREDTMGRNKLTIENITRHTHFDWDQRIQMQYYYAGMNNSIHCSPHHLKTKANGVS